MSELPKLAVTSVQAEEAESSIDEKDEVDAGSDADLADTEREISTLSDEIPAQQLPDAGPVLVQQKDSLSAKTNFQLQGILAWLVDAHKTSLSVAAGTKDALTKRIRDNAAVHELTQTVSHLFKFRQ